MKNLTENARQPIFHLINLLEETRSRYLVAAEKIKDEVLSLLFKNFGSQKGRYINELSKVIDQPGSGYMISPFAINRLQRKWKDIKSIFVSKQGNNLINDCIKSEETALLNYRVAIEETNYDAAVKMLLLQQVNGIKTVLNTIKEYNFRK